ncbi:hypothetical protein GAGA_2883 [Paraglaciecola agarilytica NO2]|uniref:Uncharacterized protein n=1 Tax=Paraglaciecola agarilytica NO2 TaxID=1125747 RepID=A0ABQ0I8P0_9ALTE|nr:hypothetical protein GAGA_2883 [Paraglaciecola agarilytica NO2]
MLNLLLERRSNLEISTSEFQSFANAANKLLHAISLGLDT